MIKPPSNWLITNPPQIIRYLAVAPMPSRMILAAAKFHFGSPVNSGNLHQT